MNDDFNLDPELLEYVLKRAKIGRNSPKQVSFVTDRFWDWDTDNPLLKKFRKAAAKGYFVEREDTIGYKVFLLTKKTAQFVAGLKAL